MSIACTFSSLVSFSLSTSSSSSDYLLGGMIWCGCGFGLCSGMVVVSVGDYVGGCDPRGIFVVRAFMVKVFAILLEVSESLRIVLVMGIVELMDWSEGCMGMVVGSCGGNDGPLIVMKYHLHDRVSLVSISGMC